MTIEELREKKTQAEDQILKIIVAFCDETKVAVKAVHYTVTPVIPVRYEEIPEAYRIAVHIECYL